MLGESESVARSRAIGMRGNGLHHGAIHCTNIYVLTARARWPKKTAEHWAAAAKRKPRMAKYWLRTGILSAEAKLAIRDLFD